MALFVHDKLEDNKNQRFNLDIVRGKSCEPCTVVETENNATSSLDVSKSITGMFNTNSNI